MKIKELSVISGINHETIRSYRNMGYLTPEQEDNGYYDYSSEDLVSLFWIRKLRGFSTSMETIHKFFCLDDEDAMLELLEKEAARLDLQITKIRSARRFISLEERHIRESRDSIVTGAEIMQSIDEKIDFYDLNENPLLIRNLYSMMTPTLQITKEILNGPVEDRRLSIRSGVGTYRYVLNENAITEIPESAVIIPNGLNVSQVVALRSLKEMNVLDLSPMMNYAKRNHLTFLSDTTGYLMRVRMIEGRPEFHFRIRACFETNNLTDPAVISGF